MSAPASTPLPSPLLTIRQLHKSFGGLHAVNALDLDVMPGEILGLLGPNGSGKTTVMNLISGALRADAGSISLQGPGQQRHELAGQPAWRIARLGVARTFQLVRVLGGMTCLENVQAGMAYRARPAFGPAAGRQALQWLACVGLEAQAQTPAQALTYIDQKRLELARALAQEPQLLLLDEWLAGLNPTELQQGIALIQSLQQRQNLTIVLVEHVMEAVRALCGRCVVMMAGRSLAQGQTAQVLADEAVIHAYLGKPAENTPSDSAHA